MPCWLRVHASLIFANISFLTYLTEYSIYYINITIFRRCQGCMSSFGGTFSREDQEVFSALNEVGKQEKQ
jgi:hypothetical protein